MNFLIFNKHHRGHAKDREYRGYRSNIKGNQLPGNGRPYVGSHNHPHRLPQCHKPGINKAYNHDCRGGRRLDHRRDARPHKHSFYSVGCELFQNGLHLVSGSGFQSCAHHLHPVQKQRQPSK